jgi:hypothetical protein
MRTFKNIQDDVYVQLKESSSDPNFWSVQEVKDAINDAYYILADDALCFRLVRIIQIISGIRIYKLPFNYIMGSLNRVEFNEKPINPVLSLELDRYSRSWRNVSGSEIQAYLPPDDICGSDEIAVYPLPDTNGAEFETATDEGVMTTVGDDSFEEFEADEGVVVNVDQDEARFVESEGSGPVIEIDDPTNNLRIFGAKYPKRMFNDNEIPLHPISHNPRKILTNGALALLFSKEGEGKDIQKASYYNKRFNEVINSFKRTQFKRMNRVRSISEVSVGRTLNLGEHYPRYIT